MEKQLRTYTYADRNCPACGSGEAELIKTISTVRQGINYEHHMEAHLSVCKECGFLFANPAEYYGDMLSVYESESSYSVEKRLELISKYAAGGVIAEIGANEQGIFRAQLERQFDQYISIDINSSYKNHYDTIKSLKSEVDILVGYCVLEHISDLSGFLSDCYARLRPEGICIIEVPDATKYYKEAHPLEMAEHINHFTPQSLTRLMCRAGFELLEINRIHASRSFAFAGVYKKKRIQQTESFSAAYDYAIGRSFLTEGLSKIAHSREVFQSSVSQIHQHIETVKNCRGRVVFWCANEMLRKIVDRLLEVYGSFESPIIDEDIRKKQFYLEYSAKTSQQAWEDGDLKRAKILFICSDCRVESIINTLKERYPQCYETLQIYYIDEECNLNPYVKDTY